ncbi:SMI1/KNR4 family protein [Lacihabitans lacunae]|uniref:SMI1/KNR4 family protein n=1 Tax=Lacihabitans lacunae TaxID=1028214 RepID=A0ABV7YQG9_9BACT
MEPIDILKSILNNEYETEDGDRYKVELEEGMTESEIKSFVKVLPNNFLDESIKELIRFSKGFNFHGLEDVSFNAFGHFGLEEVFPNSIQLASDGFGNYWVLDIGNNGEWKEVYFVCHDPAAIVKHSKNISEFIQHVDEFGRLGSESNLDIIHEKIVFDVYEGKVENHEKSINEFDFPDEFITQLPEDYVIIDLENQPIKSGFNWAKFGPNTRIIRFGDRPIWVLEKKKGFLRKIYDLLRK